MRKIICAFVFALASLTTFVAKANVSTEKTSEIIENLHESSFEVDFSAYFCTATITYKGKPMSVGVGYGPTVASACSQAEANAWANMK